MYKKTTRVNNQEKCYICSKKEKKNAIFITFLRYFYNMIIIGFNLILQFKLFFCLFITTNNNLPPIIYCENIVKIL